MFRENPTINLRELTVFIHYLPQDSLLIQYLRDDPLTNDQKLYLGILDALHQIEFESRISAMVDAGKQYQRVSNHRPKPIERPTIIPKKKEKVFLKASQLKRMLEKKVIKHTPECVASEVNKGGGQLRCNCS